MSASELRRQVQVETAKDLFGDEWRESRPWELGGLIGRLLDTIRRGEDPKLVAGLIDGRLEALRSIDAAVKQINGEE